MIGWTGLKPWEFEFPFPDSFISTLPGGYLREVEDIVDEDQKRLR